LTVARNQEIIDYQPQPIFKFVKGREKTVGKI
jgi:hypothetical protein